MKQSPLWLCLCLLLFGCAVSPVVEAPEASESPAPTAFMTAAPSPAVVELQPSFAVTEPPFTAIPTPSPTPTPTPEPTPTPTPTPDPYRAETVKTYKKSDDFWYCPLTEATKARIIGTTFPEDPKDCPIKISDLRYVRLLYTDFDGVTHTGEMIVHRKVADDVLDIFYQLYIAQYPLTEATKARIIGTTFPEDPKDCPIKISDLRYVRLLYTDFDGVTHTGEMIVHRKVADDVLDIFYQLYIAQYPLTSVKLLDDYNEPFSDGTSMIENNTSAFCCRLVTGTHHFSKHSYGVAIDVNPALNPYIRPDGSFAPENSAPYLDRTLGLPGMIDEKDLCYKLFTKHGWKWGGHFKGETDYQHFYKVLK